MHRARPARLALRLGRDTTREPFVPRSSAQCVCRSVGTSAGTATRSERDTLLAGPASRTSAHLAAGR